MKIVKADAKGRVTGFEPGVEYRLLDSAGDTVVRRTDKKSKWELVDWAVNDLLSGQLKEDRGWREHVTFAIKHEVYRNEEELWLVANGWTYARQSKDVPQYQNEQREEQ